MAWGITKEQVVYVFVCTVVLGLLVDVGGNWISTNFLNGASPSVDAPDGLVAVVYNGSQTSCDIEYFRLINEGGKGLNVTSIDLFSDVRGSFKIQAIDNASQYAIPINDNVAVTDTDTYSRAFWGDYLDSKSKWILDFWVKPLGAISPLSYTNESFKLVVHTDKGVYDSGFIKKIEWVPYSEFNLNLSPLMKKVDCNSLFVRPSQTTS